MPIPENVIDQMNDVLVQHGNLLHYSFFDRAAEIKLAMGQGSVKHMPMEDGRGITYISTLASSSSSMAFSLVGCQPCHFGISKYLTRKGQTTLSRTKNKKYLPQREMSNKGIDITNTMHSPQDWS
jgi:hypothetical protein